MKNKRFESLAYLRVIAIGMVVYAHLVWLRNPNFFIHRIVEKIFLSPLYIIQSFGALGVCLFYIISGFLFMNSKKSENYVMKQFKKILKIYFSCIIAFLGFYLANRIIWIFKTTGWSHFSARQWFLSATLIGYFTGDGDVINSNTWFLIPLFIFYLLGILIHKKGLTFSMALLGIVFVLCEILKYSGHYNSKYFYFAFYISFVFVPLTGCIFYQVYSKQINFWKGVVLSLICYGGFLCGIHDFSFHLYQDSPYLVSYIYAAAMFILFVVAENHFEPNKGVNFFNKCGLPIYLLHMTWGGGIMNELYLLGVGFGISLVIAIVMIILLAYFHQRFIDNRLLDFLK